jgi:NAD(P)-dependent dehydrogenase (short-subunit alcohol dehydrogenase family)
MDQLEVPRMGEHDGRVALVTGAATGIGAAVARLLAERGATVAVSDFHAAGARATVDAILAAGGKALAVPADVTDAHAVDHALAQVIDAYERLDILVTCAGVQRYGTATTTTEAVWDEVLDTNVKGVFLVVRAALPHLRAGGSGAIVVVSSVQATAAQAAVVAYASSKGALNAFVRAVAVDEAVPGVRVNGVSPGSVDTPMLRASAELFTSATGTVVGTLAQRGASHPLGRIGDPREVAEVVSFLAGSRAGFVTGIDVRVDGGLLAQLPVVLPPSVG